MEESARGGKQTIHSRECVRGRGFLGSVMVNECMHNPTKSIIIVVVVAGVTNCAQVCVWPLSTIGSHSGID